MSNGKKSAAGKALASLGADVNAEINNVNYWIDFVNQERAEAEADIGAWGLLGSGVGAIIGFIASSGDPSATKIGYETGGQIGRSGADYFIDEDEMTLYDVIDRGDFKFNLSALDEYQSDYEMLNVQDRIADWNQAAVTGTSLLSDIYIMNQEDV